MADKGCSDLVSKGQPPSELCLKKAAIDIDHDLRFLQLAWKHRGMRLGWTMWFVTARVVWDFFFVPKRKNIDKAKGVFADDVLASDYVDDWNATAAALKAQAPKEHKKIREAANKLTAHLTYARADKRDTGGIEPSPELHTFLMGVASVWLQQLTPKRRVWFGPGVC